MALSDGNVQEISLDWPEKPFSRLIFYDKRTALLLILLLQIGI